jgi:hypothetical protein
MQYAIVIILTPFGILGCGGLSALPEEAAGKTGNEYSTTRKAVSCR